MTQRWRIVTHKWRMMNKRRNARLDTTVGVIFPQNCKRNMVAQDTIADFMLPKHQLRKCLRNTLQVWMVEESEREAKQCATDISKFCSMLFLESMLCGKPCLILLPLKSTPIYYLMTVWALKDS